VSKPLHIQLTLSAPVADVFRALSDDAALTTWFAEHASVSLADKRYDFWGRYTPETPTEADGHREIQLVEPNRRLRYTWPLRGADTTVEFRLAERSGKTVLGLWHYDVPGVPFGQPECYALDDVWYLWLENLRRYVDGRPVTRCDFSADKTGDLALSVEIDGSKSAVWDALTKPEQLNRYFTADAKAEPTVGGVWVDWGGEHGALRVLEMVPQQKFALEWEIEGAPTVVTWTLEDAGRKTRLTLAHSGFAEGRRSDAEWGGWSNYLGLIQSLVEYGLDWVPPVKELTKQVALYYAAVIWARQDELLGEADEEWA
jgi:uncharacterized protein YndB with AHSA1/START domain